MAKATVLVVDDSADFRGAVRFALEHAGYAVHEARDGVEALASMQVRPDLVLVDISMPGMSGPQLVEELCRLEGLPPFGVIAVSGRVDARSSPTKWFLSKPVSLDLLLAVVRDFCGRRAAHAPLPGGARSSGVCAVAGALVVPVEPDDTGTSG